MNKLATITATLLLALSGCTGTETLYQAGSSTVLPLAEVWAEEFGREHRVQINVAGGGSGAGASGLCEGALDLGDMSRPMKEAEREACRANGVEPVEWTVAFDGLSVVVSRDNGFVESLTVGQLHDVFAGEVRRWNEVDASFPARDIHLCYPDSDSGTYEYFNEAVLEGTSPRTGGGVQQSADDNTLVTCVERDRDAIGYFGYAYYVENSGKVDLVAVDGGGGPVEPSPETVADGSYTPLSRPVFVYTDGVPESGSVLHDYIRYVLTDGQDRVPEVGYVPLDDGTAEEMLGQLGA